MTPYQSPTASFTISPTWTISDTPLPTSTPDVPAYLSKNVFNPQTGAPLLISLKPPLEGMVWVRVYNLAGEVVCTPFQAPLSAGITYQASWDGRNDQGDWVSNGVYFVSVKGAGIRSVRKVVLMK